MSKDNKRPIGLAHPRKQFKSIHAAKLRTSTGMHTDQKYGKSIMTSHKFSDRDNGAKMVII